MNYASLIFTLRKNNTTQKANIIEFNDYNRNTRSNRRIRKGMKLKSCTYKREITL